MLYLWHKTGYWVVADLRHLQIRHELIIEILRKLFVRLGYVLTTTETYFWYTHLAFWNRDCELFFQSGWQKGAVAQAAVRVVVFQLSPFNILRPRWWASVNGPVQCSLCVIYRVLHNGLPFSFPERFVWLYLLWLSVTLSLVAVQRIWTEMTLNRLFCRMKILLLCPFSLTVKLSQIFWLISFSKWTSSIRRRFFVAWTTPLLLASCITLEITGQQARHCVFPTQWVSCSNSKASVRKKHLWAVSPTAFWPYFHMWHDDPITSCKEMQPLHGSTIFFYGWQCVTFQPSHKLMKEVFSLISSLYSGSFPIWVPSL